MAALQKLADDARTSGRVQAAKFEAILRQCRPLMYAMEFGDVITRLLGSKEESKVATAIAKMSKYTRPASLFHPYSRAVRSRGRGGRGGRGRGACLCPVVASLGISKSNAVYN
jgi:hypothetical protein